MSLSQLSNYSTKPLIERACPVCRSDSPSEIIEENISSDLITDFSFASRKSPELMHHRLIRCSACDLMYASPIPDLAWIEKMYENAGFDSANEAKFAARTYSQVVQNIFSDLPNHDTALDVGTGEGSFLEELLKLGFINVQGVEPSGAPIKAAAEGIRPLIRKAIFNGEDYDAESFSLITSFQTLEHLCDPMVFCKDAYKLLKPGGALLVVVHNYRSLINQLLWKKSPIFDIEHLQLFSSQSAKELFTRAGFENLSQKAIINTYPLRYWIKLMPVVSKSPMVGSIIKNLRIANVAIPIRCGNLAIIGWKPRVVSGK